MPARKKKISIPPTEFEAIRKTLGLAPKMLAKRIGVSLPTIHRWARNGVPAGPESRLLRILRGLEYIERSIKRDEV